MCCYMIIRSTYPFLFHEVCSDIFFPDFGNLNLCIFHGPAEGLLILLSSQRINFWLHLLSLLFFYSVSFISTLVFIISFYLFALGLLCFSFLVF